MNFIFYQNTSKKIEVNKSLTQVSSFTGNWKNDTGVRTPTIVIESNNFPTGNYVFIADFSRYYYISEVRPITNNIFEIDLICDVLMTFADDIKASGAIIARQENKWNMYLNDGTFKTLQNPKFWVKAFPAGFTTQNFVLLTAGNTSATS